MRSFTTSYKRSDRTDTCNGVEIDVGMHEVSYYLRHSMLKTTHDEERHVRQSLDVSRQWQFLVLASLEDSSDVRLGYTGFVAEVLGTEEGELVDAEHVGHTYNFDASAVSDVGCRVGWPLISVSMPF